MEVAARLRHARVSPQKARLVADQIRGLTVDRARNLLQFSLKKSGGLIKKALDSAIANAENNAGLDIDELYISRIFVDQGPMMKRMMPRAKGRGNRILKRSSHITVIVASRS